jgi:hypothetical protein
VNDAEKRKEWVTALKSASDHLDNALTRIPVDKTALLQAIAEGVSLLISREIESLEEPAHKDAPGQLQLFPEVTGRDYPG